MLELLMHFFEHFVLLLGRIQARGTFPKPLDAAQERELVDRAAQGDPAARQLLIEHNMRLVVHVVKKYAGGRHEMDDLISIGSIGLIKAINTFRPQRETKLATYAARCIENEILMHLRSTRKLEREVSLDDPVGTDAEGNELTNQDVLGTDPDGVFDSVARSIHLEKIRLAASQVLDEREKIVFQMRYGILDGRCAPQREVAKRLGISRSYVSRLESAAISKLRNALQKSERSDSLN